MINLQSIAEKLGKAKAIPDGFLCRCPCHEDKEASLSLKITSGGNLAVNCFAGCDWKIIFEELKRQNLLPDKKEKPQQQKEIIYSYVDENGKELFQKVRFANKKGIHRHWSNACTKTGRPGWEWSIQGIRNVLYNLPNVLKSEVVYLCEGEKDADNLNRAGLTATTNNAGALTWLDIFTETLKNKVVVLCQDNDNAGQLRSKKLIGKLSDSVKELRLFIPPGVPDHGDVTDWIEAGGDAAKILELSSPVAKQASKRQKATRPQYYEMFNTLLNNPRKCIFSEKLVTYDPKTQLWNPAVNAIDIIKSEAAVLSETTNLEYSLGLVQPHFFALEASKDAEFLVDVPVWDGRSRISEMAYFMKLKESAGVTECAFSELLKEWMANMFHRLRDPKKQNQILVLQGHQGAGKDTWIDMLTDGLGQYAVPFTIAHDDKDMYLKIHRGLVMKISEFDKTAKTEVSTLKDIITTPSTDIRAPYDRDSKIRRSRCSFISSANIENILRDYTGNRRFLIFEVESISFEYKDWTAEQKQVWQMQCLAEGQYLADHNYKASQDSREQMRAYVEKRTPDDPADDTLREFQAIIKSDVIKYAGKVEISEYELTDITQIIKQRTGMNVRAIRDQLRRRVGTYRTEIDKRTWYYKIEQIQH